MQFSRKGPNFTVKKCSAICEDHFAEDRVITKKKGRLYLLKKTVPTIYYRETKVGLERVEVEFNENAGEYVGHESVNLIQGSSKVKEEKALMRQRNHKVKELKNLCRFCFESQDDKFVAIGKLEAYSIDPDEMLALIGIASQHNEVFSEIVCEHCFQQIVSIDGYRKRCCKAQAEIIGEMQELDQKLQNIRQHYPFDEQPWFKYEPMSDEEEEPQQFSVIEEYLDDISYIGEDEDDVYQVKEQVPEFATYSLPDKNDIIVKEEDKMDTMDDIIEHTPFETHYEDEEDNGEEEEEYQEISEQTDKDIYSVTDADAIIKNPDRNSFALRIYECFFCRLVRSFRAYSSLSFNSIFL